MTPGEITRAKVDALMTLMRNSVTAFVPWSDVMVTARGIVPNVDGNSIAAALAQIQHHLVRSSVARDQHECDLELNEVEVAAVNLAAADTTAALAATNGRNIHV